MTSSIKRERVCPESGRIKPGFKNSRSKSLTKRNYMPGKKPRLVHWKFKWETFKKLTKKVKTKKSIRFEVPGRVHSIARMIPALPVWKVSIRCREPVEQSMRRKITIMRLIINMGYSLWEAAQKQNQDTLLLVSHNQRGRISYFSGSLFLKSQNYWQRKWGEKTSNSCISKTLVLLRSCSVWSIRLGKILLNSEQWAR